MAAYKGEEGAQTRVEGRHPTEKFCNSNLKDFFL